MVLASGPTAQDDARPEAVVETIRRSHIEAIQIERIKPGHPQENGRHERMHLTLKREATKPAAANVLQQQARFDDFTTRYNTDRPHQALGMKVNLSHVSLARASA